MNLGIVLGDAGERGDEAVAAEQDAMAILSEADDRHGAVQALVNLVGILIEAGRFDEAVTAGRRVSHAGTRARQYEP